MLNEYKKRRKKYPVTKYFFFFRSGPEPAEPSVLAAPAVGEFTLEPLVIQEIPQEEAAILQSRVDEITLREEQPKPQVI